jgi:hypothetical protein
MTENVAKRLERVTMTVGTPFCGGGAANEGKERGQWEES